MLLVHHVHTCAPVWFLDKYQVNKGQRFQESFRSVLCKLAIEGSPYCRFTGCVITASVSSFWGRFTIQLHKADTVSALRSHTNTHLHTQIADTTLECTESKNRGTWKTNTYLLACLCEFIILERIKWMFVPSIHSSWFLALLLALTQYANNRVTAKVSDYTDWMGMTGSIWPTCGQKSHAERERTHAYTHTMHKLSTQD